MKDFHQVLSNETRLKIMHWLKKPHEHFPPHAELGHFRDGVCVQFITEKAGLSSSTTSHYLTMMEKIGLIISTRHGKWTYYRRNEKIIKAYIKELKQNL